MERIAEFFAGAMKVGPNRIERKDEGLGDLVVSALLLMIEDEDRTLDG